MTPWSAAGPVATSSLDVEEAQELASKASFRELLARLVADERDFMAYQMAKDRSDSRKHVLSVQHNKQQLLKGASSVAQLLFDCRAFPRAWGRCALQNPPQSSQTDRISREVGNDLHGEGVLCGLH